MNDSKANKIESLVFKKLIKHFRDNPTLQNIDLMEYSGFCRNCLSKWYLESAEKLGEKIDYNKARELIYGMPYEEWKKKYQTNQPKDRIKDFKSKHKN